jgi:hypothetical protein
MFQSGLINTFYYDRFLGVRIYARWPFVCRSGSHSCRCLWTLFTELPRRGLLGNLGGSKQYGGRGESYSEA